MLKAMIARRFSDNQTAALFNFDITSMALDFLPSRDPSKLDWYTYGFPMVPAFGKDENGEDSRIYDNGAGLRCILVEKRERVLPGKVIKRQVDAYVAEVERQEDRKIGKREYAQIKESVTNKLLPDAFIKATHIPVIITPTYLMVGTSSVKVFDDIMETFRTMHQLWQGDNPIFAMRPIYGNEDDLQKWLRETALGSKSDSFRPFDSVTFQRGDKSTFRISHASVADESDLLTSANMVKELGLIYDKSASDQTDMTFKLNHAGIIKGIKIADIITADMGEHDGSEAGRFDAAINLYGGELKGLLDKLQDALAERKEAEDEL